MANFGTNTVSVLINEGYGANFAPAVNFVVGSSPNPGPCAITVADVNRDGRIDIIVANYNEGTVSVLTNTAGSGGRVFGLMSNYNVGAGPSSVCVADFDGDGVKDILTANKLDGTLTILPGQTNGTFGDPVTIPLVDPEDPNPGPVDALPGDFNGDGNLDIAVVNQTAGTVSILPAQPDQPLSDRYSVINNYLVGDSPTSLLVRDLNRDGIPDVVVANSGDNNISVLLCNGDGTFQPAVNFSVGQNPAVVVGSNFNSDNATDLAVANTGDNTVSVLLYDGPLADNFTWNVWENVPTNVPLRGQILSGAPLNYIINTPPSNGTLSGPTANLVIYTPDPDYVGTDSFTYSASTSDGTLTSVVAVVTLNVLLVNHAPSFDLSMTNVVVKEDAPKTNIADFATNILKGPTNESSQKLSFIVTTTSNSFFASRPVISSLGVLSFRPAPNVTGTVMVNAQLKDNGGTARGGTNLSPVQSFTIEVQPNPIKPLQGIYTGLFYETNGGTNNISHQSSGYFKFTMQASGVFSGTLIAEGISYPFTGLFDESGYTWSEVIRNDSTLDVTMQLDLTTDHTDEVVGTVQAVGGWTAQLLGNRLVYNAVTNPAPQAGQYTLVIPGGTDSASNPGGDGYATVTVNTAGKVTASGRLGDDTPWSQTTYLSGNGQWPMYAPLYSKRGSVLGWLNITNAVEGDVQGEVSWIKTGLAGGTYYVNGFTNEVAVVGSTYTNPASSGRVLNITDGTHPAARRQHRRASQLSGDINGNKHSRSGRPEDSDTKPLQRIDEWLIYSSDTGGETSVERCCAAATECRPRLLPGDKRKRFNAVYLSVTGLARIQIKPRCFLRRGGDAFFDANHFLQSEEHRRTPHQTEVASILKCSADFHPGRFP